MVSCALLVTSSFSSLQLTFIILPYRPNLLQSSPLFSHCQSSTSVQGVVSCALIVTSSLLTLVSPADLHACVPSKSLVVFSLVFLLSKFHIRLGPRFQFSSRHLFIIVSPADLHRPSVPSKSLDDFSLVFPLSEFHIRSGPQSKQMVS